MEANDGDKKMESWMTVVIEPLTIILCHTRTDYHSYFSLTSLILFLIS